jgi:hypothetical protein
MQVLLRIVATTQHEVEKQFIGDHGVTYDVRLLGANVRPDGTRRVLILPGSLRYGSDVKALEAKVRAHLVEFGFADSDIITEHRQAKPGQPWELLPAEPAKAKRKAKAR